MTLRHQDSETPKCTRLRNVRDSETYEIPKLRDYETSRQPEYETPKLRDFRTKKTGGANAMARWAPLVIIMQTEGKYFPIYLLDVLYKTCGGKITFKSRIFGVLAVWDY